jgi:hypothetical protein
LNRPDPEIHTGDRKQEHRCSAVHSGHVFLKGRDGPQEKLVMVPFADAGQTKSGYEASIEKAPLNGGRMEE